MTYNLCDIIKVSRSSERLVRYVVERGIVKIPQSLHKPGTGNHRDFCVCTARQVALATILLCAGFKASKVREVIDKATVAIAGGCNPLRFDLTTCDDKVVEVRVDTTNVMQGLP